MAIFWCMINIDRYQFSKGFISEPLYGTCYYPSQQPPRAIQINIIILLFCSLLLPFSGRNTARYRSFDQYFNWIICISVLSGKL